MFTNEPSGFFNPNSGGAGGGGGGGRGGFAPDGPNTQFGGRRNTNERRSKVFTPVTIRMLLNAQPRPDDICEFDGDPINDIILVGRILRRVDEPMRTQFEINDNTGTFWLLFYHKGENQVPIALRNFNYEQFCYAKVYGNIRVFREEKAIVGTHIKRVDKMDEMTNHFLSTFVAHCIRKKGVLKPRELALDQATANQLAGDSAMGGGSNQYSSNYNQHVGGGAGDRMQGMTGPGASAAAGAGQSLQTSEKNLSGPGELKRAILDIMRELSKSSKMVHKANVYGVLQNRTDQGSFEHELERMQEDGEIAQSIDNNHFVLID